MRKTSIFILIFINLILFSKDKIYIKIQHKNNLYVIDPEKRIYLHDNEIGKMNKKIYEKILKNDIICNLLDNIFYLNSSIEIITNENIGIFDGDILGESIITGKKKDLQTIIFINGCWYGLDDYENINGYNERIKLEFFLNSLKI